MNYSQEDNLLIQSYMTMSLLLELKAQEFKGNSFFESDYYKQAKFDDNFVKQTLPTIGIDNQGALLIALYTILVIPKELIEKKYRNDFEKLNDFIRPIAIGAESTYKKDKDENGNPDIDYIRHIRNSVAHARVEFIPNQKVIFSDEFKGQTCTIPIKLEKLSLLLTEIRKIFLKHVESIQQDIKDGKIT